MFRCVTMLFLLSLMVTLVIGCSVGLHRTPLGKWRRQDIKVVGISCDMPIGFMNSGNTEKYENSELTGNPERDGAVFHLDIHPFDVPFDDSVFTMYLYLFRLPKDSYSLFAERKHLLSSYLHNEICGEFPKLREVRIASAGISGSPGKFPLMWIRRDIPAPNGDMIVGAGMFILHSRDPNAPLNTTEAEDEATIKRILMSITPTK